MKKLFFIIFLMVFISFESKSQIRFTKNQEQITAFIKKYQDSIASTSDCTAKVKILYNMWYKHMKFIQDTLKISYNSVDTFIFKRAIIKEKFNSNNKRTELKIILDNDYYFATMLFSWEKKEYLQKDKFYKQAKAINENNPVKALINLQGFMISIQNIEMESSKIMLNIRLFALYNVN